MNYKIICNPRLEITFVTRKKILTVIGLKVSRIGDRNTVAASDIKERDNFLSRHFGFFIDGRNDHYDFYWAKDGKIQTHLQY